MQKIYRLMLLPLTLGLLLVVASFAGAAPLRPPQESEFLTDVSVQGYDDSYLEVGVEWVEDYSTLGWGDLPATEPDALGLYNRLGNCGWTKKFKWGNNSAWEQDWKGYSQPGGGKEYLYADNVDLAYFAGHGGSSAFYFNSTVDDHSMSYTDCDGNWGDKDAEWIGIAACNVLDDAHQKDWSYCFDGLHLMLSFKTTMADVPHGDKWGQYICAGWNMTAAWFKAADLLQPQGKIARVLAEEYHHFWDRPSDHNASDAMNYATYWKWTHTVGSEPARYVDVSQLQSMPVFQTPPLSLGEAEAEWANLGTAFGVNTKLGKSVELAQDNEIWVSGDSQLEMDTSAGLYAFTDKDELWAPPPTTSLASAVHMRTLSAEDAKTIADTFLNNNGLMPGDAQYYETVAETVTETPEGEVLSAQAVTDTLTSYQVIYSRIITYTPALQAEPIEFSVMGPGAKTKVYVAPEAPAKLSLAQAAAQGSVIGGVGGWRGVGTQKLDAVADVTILSLEQITALFNELESTVALSYVPLPWETRNVTTYTVGYYEHPMGTGQDQLIPVYVLEVEYALTGGETVSSTAYIPANEQYMAPFAQITGTDGIPDVLAVGDEVTMEAVDAATQLAALGYDPSLNFVLGSGVGDDYLYSWYLDTVSPETKIGTGRYLTYTVTAGSGGHTGAFPLTQSIILQVEDSASPRPPSTSIDTYQLNVGPPVYLPSVLKLHGSP